jgi:hypothetical protein
MPEAEDFSAVFAILKPILKKHVRSLAVQADTAEGYSLVTKRPSPFPQHKGEPMFFGAVRTGKSYVSFHLMPLYMNPRLQATLPPGLKKRMQGKSCFNFKEEPAPEIVAELGRLTAACLDDWRERKWL